VSLPWQFITVNHTGIMFLYNQGVKQLPTVFYQFLKINLIKKPY